MPDFNIFLLRRLERALFAPKTSPRYYAAATHIKDVVQFSIIPAKKKARQHNRPCRLNRLKLIIWEAPKAEYSRDHRWLLFGYSLYFRPVNDIEAILRRIKTSTVENGSVICCRRV